MIRFILPSLIALFVLGCAPVPTRIALSIEYEDDWNIGLMEVRGSTDDGERDVRLPAQRSLEIWVPDSWAGREVRFHVRGLRGADDAIATGRGTVVPVLGSTTSLSIRLHLVACGAWCTTGETRCFGDASAICEQRDSDHCMEWGTPQPCPADAPYCSLGQCRAQCIDECADGEQRCDGPSGYQLCGDFDEDSCREWSTTTMCGDGQSCHAGVCTTGACRDQCTSGATECRDGSIVTCGDLNDDGCTEWGPAMRCAMGETCESGACRSIESCSDECSVNECDGTSFHECGQFDEDPCRDRSPGLSCAPLDLCLEGTCSATTGCASTARSCTSPPAQTCINTSTLRVYDAVGECTAGECNYAPRDIACANCPSCGDLCASVTCNTPPAAACLDSSTLRTYAPTGTCTAGTCSYTPIDTPCLLGCSGGRCTTGGRTFEAYLKASNTNSDDRFGWSVSLSGDLLAVSAPVEDSSATGVNGDQADNSTSVSGAVYVFRRSTAGSWTQEAYLKASNTDYGDRFGASLSLSGDLLAVGAPDEDSSTIGDQANNAAYRSGAVYVFRRSTNGT